MLTRYNDPFRALFDLQKAVDQRRRSNWLRNATTARGSYPPINMFQKGDDFVAIIELAGIDKSDLDVQAKDNIIRISGKKSVSFPEGISVHRRERVSGTFDRTISVPVKIDPDGIRAEYRDGVLALSIPRAEADKPKSVTIN